MLISILVIIMFIFSHNILIVPDNILIVPDNILIVSHYIIRILISSHIGTINLIYSILCYRMWISIS